jgi:hypothetical protein
MKLSASNEKYTNLEMSVSGTLPSIVFVVRVSPPPGLTTLSSSVQETKVNATIAEKKKDFIMVFGVKSGKKNMQKYLLLHILSKQIFFLASSRYFCHLSLII